MVVRIRWERIGATLVAVALIALEGVAQDYAAMMFAMLATAFMCLYFKSDDSWHNAMKLVLTMHLHIQKLEGGSDDDTKAQS